MVEFSLPELLRKVSAWKGEGKKIVFTNGVFDILHVGHVTYLEAAAELGDILVVGVNDDASVRRLNKGPERPINPQEARAKVISALQSVGAAVIFAEDTPFNLIKEIEPDVLVKGGDYDPDCTNPENQRYMVGSDLVKSRKGEVVAIPLVQGFSTTSIVGKLKG